MSSMRRPSEYLAKLEDRLAEKLGPWFDRHKAKFPVYIPLGLAAWYFYGMFLNSLRLGTAATFHTAGEEVESIWVLNPFRNWLVVLTPFGLGVTAVIVLLICLITKKGYIWFSGYKYTRDPRGFDILPDATHGSPGFLTKKETEASPPSAMPPSAPVQQEKRREEINPAEDLDEECDSPPR